MKTKTILAKDLKKGDTIVSWDSKEFEVDYVVINPDNCVVRYWYLGRLEETLLALDFKLSAS